MRWRALGGPMVLAVWQFAPVTTAQDSLGRVRIGFGYGGGRFEQTSVDCSGDVIGSARAKYATGGVNADVWLANRFRISGFATRQTVDDEIDVSGSGASVFAGTTNYYGIQFAHEGQRFGLGLGSVRGGGATFRPLQLSTYMRIGDIDGVHFRSDFNDPSALFGTLGTLRVGLERNAGHLRGPSWFAGLAACHFCGDTVDPSVFGVLRIPVKGPFEATAQGLFGAGDQGSVASWGVGFRASF